MNERSDAKNELAVLEAVDLWKSYETESAKVEVLKGLNLSVGRGEFVAICGVSGVGKSTLLHLFGGLDRQDRGRLLFQARGEPAVDLNSLSEHALNRFRGEHVGFVFQFHHLLPEFSALENVSLPAVIRGVASGEAKERATVLLESVGLAERLTHRPSQLSGGEAQRVAIARALINSPELLLMDEPTGNLDRERSDKIFELIHSIHLDRGPAVILVTHDEALASKAQRVVHLVGGMVEKCEPRIPTSREDASRREV